MPKANPEMQPNAQPDVPRADPGPGGPLHDTPTAHTEAGPVHGALARALNDLRNASSAVGPVNYLPDTWPEAEIAVLRQATEIVLRIVDANNAAR